MTCPSLSTLRSVKVQVRSVQELLKSAVGAALFRGIGIGRVLTAAGGHQPPQPGSIQANATESVSYAPAGVKGPMARRSARPEGHRRTGMARRGAVPSV